MKRLIYKLLLAFTVISTSAGLISLLPSSGASYASLLGYKSLCTLNPASALFCFLIAGTSCFIRSTFFKYESGSAGEKIRKHLRSLIPLSIILILATASTFWFIEVDSRYNDTLSGATQLEEQE